jgi:hypothetical protein
MGTKISDLGALTTLADADIFVVVDDTDSTTKKITKANVFSSPTIVTPTVASFVNATHDHSNAAGGGVLDLEDFGLYFGRVGADGVAVDLPATWTSSLVSTGRLKVTHNLGSSNYTVVPVVGGLTTLLHGPILGIGTATTNYFEVIIESDGVLDSWGFHFVLKVD